VTGIRVELLLGNGFREELGLGKQMGFIFPLKTLGINWTTRDAVNNKALSLADIFTLVTFIVKTRKLPLSW